MANSGAVGFDRDTVSTSHTRRAERFGETLKTHNKFINSMIRGDFLLDPGCFLRQPVFREEPVLRYDPAVALRRNPDVIHIIEQLLHERSLE
jgi:hypothetical protein